MTSDRLDLVVSALSRLGTGDRNSFPVVLDVVYVTTDKAAPPEKLPEERRPFDFVLDEPVK